MRILPVLFVTLLSVSACTTTQSASNAALERRVAALEAELDQAQSKQMAAVRKDPLMETHSTLERIARSPANDISALSYVRGSYGKDVTVYPVAGEDVRRASISSVLRNKDEDYAKHMQQLGEPLYTPQYSQDVVVYSLDGVDIPIVQDSVEYPAPVKAVTKRPTQSRTVLAEPIYHTPTYTSREDGPARAPSRPAREGRSLTAYDSNVADVAMTPISSASDSPRSLTGY